MEVVDVGVETACQSQGLRPTPPNPTDAGTTLTIVIYRCLGYTKLNFVFVSPIGGEGDGYINNNIVNTSKVSYRTNRKGGNAVTVTIRD